MTIATATKSRPADFLRRLSHRYQILGLFEKIFSAFIRETVEVDAENHIHIKIEYTGKIIFHRHLIVHQRVVLLIGKLKLRIAEVEHRRSIGRVIDRTARLHLYLARIPGIGYRIDNDEYAAIDFFIDGNLSLTPFTGVDILGNRLLQIVYSYLIDGDKSIDTAEKELFASLEKSYELYHLLLLIPVEVTHLQRLRIDNARSKFMATAEERTPNTRMIDNRFVAQLEENKTFSKYIEERPLVWNDDTNYLRSLLDRILSSEIYAQYLEAEDSYENDRTFWKNIYRRLIFSDENLGEILESQSLYWNDDMPIISTFVLKTVKRFEESAGNEQELLPMFKDEDDRIFARTLFRRALLDSNDNKKLIEQFTRNWEIERIAFMDIVIMIVALAEITSFPSIPLQVSFNEYIEIAKSYSTSKSGNFINGVLEAITSLLKKEGRLEK